MQRDRNFDHYQDGVYYDRRPSLWVEPKGQWGKGSIQLVEIPTDDAWAAGLVYIAYDTFLLAFTFIQTLPLARPLPQPTESERPSIGVIVAARDEALVLPVAGCRALFGPHTDPPDQILVADDGSTDTTNVIMKSLFGLRRP